MGKDTWLKDYSGFYGHIQKGNSIMPVNVLHELERNYFLDFMLHERAIYPIVNYGHACGE
ncbi:MAG: hypothetical protein QXQ48_09195 [Nitrososphaerota archaeon]